MCFLIFVFTFDIFYFFSFWRVKEVMSKAYILGLEDQKANKENSEDSLTNLKVEVASMAEQIKMLRLELLQMKQDTLKQNTASDE